MEHTMKRDFQKKDQFRGTKNVPQNKQPHGVIPYIDNKNITKELVDELFQFANENNLSKMKEFMLMHKIPINVRSVDGNYLLHMFTNNPVDKLDDFNLLRAAAEFPELLSQAILPNNQGITPLHLASMRQYKHFVGKVVDIIRNGISAPIDLNHLVDLTGKTPLHYATMGYIQLCNKQAGLGIITLHAQNIIDINANICADINMSVVSALLGLGLSLNKKDKYGKTPLYYIIKYNNHGVLDRLIYDEFIDEFGRSSRYVTNKYIAVDYDNTIYDCMYLNFNWYISRLITLDDVQMYASHKTMELFNDGPNKEHRSMLVGIITSAIRGFVMSFKLNNEASYDKYIENFVGECSTMLKCEGIGATLSKISIFVGILNDKVADSSKMLELRSGWLRSYVRTILDKGKDDNKYKLKGSIEASAGRIVDNYLKGDKNERAIYFDFNTDFKTESKTIKDLETNLHLNIISIALMNHSFRYAQEYFNELLNYFKMLRLIIMLD